MKKLAFSQTSHCLPLFPFFFSHPTHSHQLEGYFNYIRQYHSSFFQLQFRYQCSSSITRGSHSEGSSHIFSVGFLRQWATELSAFARSETQ